MVVGEIATWSANSPLPDGGNRPPIVTLAPPSKFVPVMVTAVPPSVVLVAGLITVIVGEVME
jgi:hypothetical protein